MLLLRYASFASEIPSSVIWQSFLVGFRFDLSITGYILAPAAFIELIPGIGLIESRITRRIVTIYFSIMASIAFLMNMMDLEFFGLFNSRLNHLLIAWIDTPKIVFQMLVEMVFFIPYLLVWLALTAVTYLALNRLSNSMFRRVRDVPRLQQWIIYPLTLLLIFGAIRGRVSIKAPLTWGVAYFSPYHFANQLALNSCFTFMRDMLDRQKQREAPYLRSLTREQAYSNVRDMLHIDSSNVVQDHPIAHSSNSDDNIRYNVVIVLMESFAADFVGSCNGRRSLAPEFDRISESGMLFPRFYSSGGHTFTGVFSTLTGLPSLPGRSIMKRSEGQQQFSGIATVLKERGYHTRFYTTHDPHFDNMAGFLTGNGFDKIIGQSDYPADEVVSSLGVPDEVMYDHILNDLNQVRGNFLTVMLTGSAHGPYIHPDRPFPHTDLDDPDVDRFNAFSYADWAFARFYEKATESDWGDSTLFVVLGDHGVNWQPKVELDLSLYRVPLLLVCEDIIEPSVKHRIGGQPDVVATIMDLLGGKWVNNTLGQSLLNDNPGYALLVEGDAYGFIVNDNYFVYNRNSGSAFHELPEYKVIIDQMESQRSMQDQAISMLSAAKYMLIDRLVGLPELIAGSE